MLLLYFLPHINPYLNKHIYCTFPKLYFYLLLHFILFLFIVSKKTPHLPIHYPAFLLWRKVCGKVFTFQGSFCKIDELTGEVWNVAHSAESPGGGRGKSCCGYHGWSSSLDWIFTLCISSWFLVIDVKLLWVHFLNYFG